MTLSQHSSQIWTIDHFLTLEECQDLIRYSESIGYTEATVSLPQGAQMMKGIRDNSRLIYTNKDLADKYWQKLSPYCPDQMDGWKAAGLNEQMRFYKYTSNQRFKRHIDGRFKRSDQEESRITFMIYLNDDMTGGETIFDNIAIKPVTGTALCFIHELKHEGSCLINGTKYVLRSDVMYAKE